MRRHGLLVAALLLVALTAPGCAKRIPVGDAERPEPAADSAAAAEPAAEPDARPSWGEDATLQVENNSPMDVRIFVLRGSLPTRVGIVTGMSSAAFPLKSALIAADIRLYASPIGGWRRIRTDAFRVRPGQVVSWKLDNNFRSDRLSIY